jgi:CheY-like chemotaxis protein
MPTSKILLVDDTKLFLELEKAYLKLSPVRVLTAGNGVEALEIIRKERPDLIYMDLNMPQMDGSTCCSVLKADPALRSIPVIMVTSAGREDDIRLCREAGCDDYLTKPVSRRVFLDKGRKFLDGIDRREIRVACSTLVKFRVHNLRFSGVSADISTGGIFVSTDYELEPLTPVELDFSLPESGCVLQNIRGQVAWRNSSKHPVKPSMPAGFGVEFMTPGKEVTDIIGTFVELSS